MTLDLDPDRATLITGGPIHTMGTAGTVPAVLFERGRITGAGAQDELAERAPDNHQHLDLDGATLLPGLIDTHPHLMHYGTLQHPLVDISDAGTHDDIIAAIATRATERPPGEWIMTTPVGEPHYFLRRSWRDLAEGVLPDRNVLDRAAPEHPVYLQAWAPVTPNVCAFNSAALRELGIDRSTPDQVGRVTIEKDDTGEPTGRFLGSVNNYYNDEPFFDALLRKIPLRDPGAAMAGTIEAMAAYNALGVTTVFEGHALGHGEIRLYRWLSDNDRLSVRVLCSPEAEVYGMPWIEKPLTDAEFEASLERAHRSVDLHGDMLRVDGVTISRGGPCWPGFLLMRRPYTGPDGSPTTGKSFVSRQRAALAAEFCASHDLRLSIVAAGDREHDEYLDDLELLSRSKPIADRRWLLQHVYLLSQSQAERYARLGMVATTSMSFSWGKGDLIAERIGDDVLGDLIPIRRLLDAGCEVGAGSDWGPKNVFEQIGLSLTHEFASGRSNLGTPQRIDRLTALSLWTSAAASVLNWQGVGSIAPSHHADLVIVDRDPLAAAVDDLAETRVLATLLAGQPVHDSGDLAI